MGIDTSLDVGRSLVQINSKHRTCFVDKIKSVHTCVDYTMLYRTTWQKGGGRLGGVASLRDGRWSGEWLIARTAERPTPSSRWHQKVSQVGWSAGQVWRRELLCHQCGSLATAPSPPQKALHQLRSFRHCPCAVLPRVSVFQNVDHG